MLAINLIRTAALIVIALFFAATSTLYVQLQHLSDDPADVGPPRPLPGGRARSALVGVERDERSAEKELATSPKENLRHAMLGGGGGGGGAGAGPPPSTSWTPSRLAAGGQGGRFPLRGTPEFSAECGWTLSPLPDGNCTVLIRPEPRAQEGVSNWVARVVDGYILSRQAGCGLMLDYGEGGVDVRRVVEPLTDAASGSGAAGEGMYNWTVPSGFECREDERCFRGVHRMKAGHLAPGINRTTLAFAPNYRFSLAAKVRNLAHCPLCLFEDSALDLQRALPGFRIETGYACAHSNLFRLAPGAAEFEPRLFEEILPALHDDRALAISIYIRTGNTDDMIKREERVRKGEINATEPLEEKDFTGAASKMLQCVEFVERRYLRGELDAGRDHGTFDKVVWMVLTDSVKLKSWLATEYTGPSVLPNLHRTVLVTRARGIQTRPDREPSQADFAEALIDWLLIGESDVVASNKLTFGSTGGMRTARPLYNLGHMGGECERKVFVHTRP